MLLVLYSAIQEENLIYLLPLHAACSAFLLFDKRLLSGHEGRHLAERLPLAYRLPLCK